MQFSELVTSPDLLMGAKAVFGDISSHVMCFGARGEMHTKRRYSVAAGAANRATERPFILAVGGGSRVRDNLHGCVLNVVRASTRYGETAAFVPDKEAERLAQWPVGLLLHDVWAIDGFPHQIRDLGLPDLRLLAGAQDGIVRPEPRISELWEALSSLELTLQALPPPTNMFDDGVPIRVARRRSLFNFKTHEEEGRRLWKLQLSTERDRILSQVAKDLNTAKHGQPTCEACSYSTPDREMFDAHHPVPLCAGKRTTHAQDLVILCPTCHRRAHRKSQLDPYDIDELREWVAADRP